MYLSEIKQLVGKKVELKGWVFNARSSGSISFLQFRDGTGYIQIIAEKKNFSDENWEVIKSITQESSVKVIGIIREEIRSAYGYEMDLSDFEIYQIAPVDYPLQPKEHGADYLLDNRHYWLRTPTQTAIIKVRNEIIYAIYDFFRQEGFIKIDSPIFTPNACEGTTTLFEVGYTPAWPEEYVEKMNKSTYDSNKFFDKEGKKLLSAYLSQSGQLYLEAAIAAHSKVFDFGPTFRAERSKTRRHLTEFWMMDAEMAFFDHKDNMKTQEKMVKFIIKRCLENCEPELKLLERDTTILKKILEKDFAIIEHKEAIKMLKEKDDIVVPERDDLGADEEAALTMHFDTPIFVEKYPREVKAFYMKEDPNDPTRVLNADMLAPEGVGEIIGGSQREELYDKLKKRMDEEKINIEDYKWYLDLRKYGSVPHSGFGIGLERTVRWITGRKHIRECIPFPRMINRITP